MNASTDVPKQSRFSIVSFTSSRRRFFATVVMILLVGGAVGYYAPRTLPRVIVPAIAQGTRDYTLVIQGKDIPVAPGPDGNMGTSDDVIWHAWTYNGTVPGPTLYGKVGDIFRVTVINNLNLKHSFHTHLAPYNFENDGSQANALTGIGAAGMIDPNGGSYPYQFQLTEAGLFYYHCHSSDGGYMINQHILQGLYGAIVVDKPDTPPVRDNTIFMAEIGFNVAGTGAPSFIMNGIGIPGGETTLEQIFSTKGLAGVVDQFNKTVPAFKANVGETIRLHIVNIGNLYHSFHLHGTNMMSQWYFPGRIWPANVVQLLPGAADSVIIQPQFTGVWLFHCHVVSHADAGMIGVLQVV